MGTHHDLANAWAHFQCRVLSLRWHSFRLLHLLLVGCAVGRECIRVLFHSSGSHAFDLRRSRSRYQCADSQPARRARRAGPRHCLAGFAGGIIAAFGPVIFTILNEEFGYDPARNNECTAPDTCGPPEENAAAAGAALVFTSSVPWMVCGALYTSLHYFYPRDMERIFERRRLENEQAEAALNTELVS